MRIRQKNLIKKLILYLIILQILLPAWGVCAESGIYLPDQYAKTNDLSASNFSTALPIDKDHLTEDEKKLSHLQSTGCTGFQRSRRRNIICHAFRIC